MQVQAEPEPDMRERLAASARADAERVIDDQGLTIDAQSLNRLQVGLKYAQFGYFFEGIRKTAPSRGGGMAFIAEFVDFAGTIMGAQAYGSAKPKMVADLAEWFALDDEDIYLATVHARDEGAPAIAGLASGSDSRQKPCQGDRPSERATSIIAPPRSRNAVRASKYT